jgi:hypothetical protein
MHWVVPVGRRLPALPRCSISINFIPNDPQDSELPMRVVSPRPDRAANRAGLNFFAQQPEDTYDPATQTAGFVFWQCREAALAALEAWEDVSGAPFTSCRLEERSSSAPTMAWT